MWWHVLVTPALVKSRVQDQFGLYKKYDNLGDVASPGIRKYIYIYFCKETKIVNTFLFTVY